MTVQFIFNFILHGKFYLTLLKRDISLLKVSFFSVSPFLIGIQ